MDHESKMYLEIKLNELEKTLMKQLIDIKLEQEKLKIKSGIWGIIGGSIPVLTSLLIYTIAK